MTQPGAEEEWADRWADGRGAGTDHRVVPAAGPPPSCRLYQSLIEQDPLPYSDTLHHDYQRAFAREDVREVLLRLSELYRAPLVLRYMDGFAAKEIARLLDVPLGTVLAGCIRGRKRFEQELWAYAQETRLLLKGTVQ